jgi:hypothetical protein
VTLGGVARYTSVKEVVVIESGFRIVGLGTKMVEIVGRPLKTPFFSFEAIYTAECELVT